jgi:arylsulfate sulfotransferase
MNIKSFHAALVASLCAAPLWASTMAPGAPVKGISSPAYTVHNDSSPATTSVFLSTTFFDFGDNLVGNELTQTVVAVTNTGSNPLTMSPKMTGDPNFSIAVEKSCPATLAGGQTCDMVLRYIPTVASAPAAQSATLNMRFGNVSAATPQTVAISGTSALLAPGKVLYTNNQMAALYTMTLPFPGKMTVNFGLTESYGLQTWSQSTDSPDGTVNILVAGMLQGHVYHMAATVAFDNGISVNDIDHKFRTGEIPSGLRVKLTATTTAGMTPQPGLELLNPTGGVIISDLQGRELWSYSDPGQPALNSIYGVKQLPDGNMLMTIGALSSNPLLAPLSADSILEMREVTLGGDTVREITINDLNAMLAYATCKECNVTLETFHHDVEPLPNGHWLVLSNTLMNLSSTSKPPLTNAPAQAVLGDVIVDLDENLQPVWVWNEFNHLNPNRHPMQFPDWTHTNAVVYSPDDGNIIVSMRHQNWVVKVNYNNGQGNGDILWKLGEGGTFKLKNGVDPTDWNYAQHGPSFFSPNTSGVFSLGLMDNGDDREFPAGVTCSTSGTPAPACQYTTIPVFKIDEVGKTATLTFHQILPADQYSYFGGNTDELANGDVEYDDCGLATGSNVREVTQEANPKQVWQLHVETYDFYRAFRIPSLYPGVQW